MYFLVITLMSILILFFRSNLRVSKSEIAVVSLISLYLLVGSIIRYFYYEADDIRDFLEYTRFLPVFILFLFSHEFSKLKFSFFLNTLKVYIVIDFIVSYLQYNHIRSVILDIIEKASSSTNQIELSLGLAHRTLGLSSGPGDHGIVVLFMVSILFVAYIRGYKSSASTIFVLLMGIYSIMTSQSQTAFIGLLFLHMLVFGYYLFKEKNKGRFIYYFIFIAIVSSVFIYTYMEELEYLMKLFTQGLNRSSYHKREVKTSYLFNLAFSSNLGIFWGWGKSYFGELSGKMDNELLYVLLVYGPLFAIFFIFYSLKLSWDSFQTNDLQKQIFILLMILGIPLSWPGSYYLTPKIMLLLIMFYINFYKEKNEFITSSRS